MPGHMTNMSRYVDVPVRAVRMAIVLRSARATSPAASRERLGMGLCGQAGRNILVFGGGDV
jgi:hypothetical protein